MVQATSDPDTVTVNWELDVTDSPLLRTLAYVSPSIFGGIALLAGGLLLWLVVSAVLDGDPARAAWSVAIVVLALLSHRYILAVLDTDITDPFWNRYSRRGLVIGSVCGALVLLGSTQVHPAAPFAVFIASWVPLVITAAFPTSGHADLAAGALVVDDSEVPLTAVNGFRAVSVGTVAVCWLSYTRGVPSASRFILLPATYLDVVSELVDTESDSSNQGRSTIGRTERLVAGLFGFGMVALGPILRLILPPGDGQAIALYAGVMFGLFGILLLWYAYSA